MFGSLAQQHFFCLSLLDEVNSAWLPDKRYAGLSSGSLRPAVTLLYYYFVGVGSRTVSLQYSISMP
jgi:hypothetical protein